MLLHLSTQLCTTLKEDQALIFVEEHVFPFEKYRPAFNAPALPGKVHLDFQSKDADGGFAAPEADLKSSVFLSTSPRPVTVARGAPVAERAKLGADHSLTLTWTSQPTAKIYCSTSP